MSEDLPPPIINNTLISETDLLFQFSLDEIHKLHKEIKDEKTNRKTILSNGWETGTYCIAYLRMLHLRKKKLYERAKQKKIKDNTST